MSVSHRIGTRRVDENVRMFPSLHESVVITPTLLFFLSILKNKVCMVS